MTVEEYHNVYPDSTSSYIEMSVSIEEMSEAFLEARARVFRALGDETRLRILRNLSEEGEMNPSGLRRVTGKDLNLLSHHLSCLENCGLVESERRGRNVFYRPKDGVEEFFEWVDEHLRGEMDSVLCCEVVE